MPPFAEALGVKCQTCHTMVPLLNSYGRYLQRTFYAPITSQAMRGTLPVYFEEQIESYSTGKTDSVQPNKKITIGNLEASIAGFAGPEFTYRVENTLYSGDQPKSQSTGPETMWLAYHGLFHGNGHLLIGDDYPGPVASFVLNPSDYDTAFHLRHLTIGTHSYNLENSRLSARFDYDRGPVDAEIAWRGGSNNPLAGGPSDFGILPGTDRIYQWKFADAPPGKPWEIGAFGGIGSYVLTGRMGTSAGPPNIDRYNIWAPYFEVDPNSIGKGVPGLYGFYANAHDSNPGILHFDTLAPQGPHAMDQSVELVEALFKGQGTITLREESATNGLGAVTHYYATGASYEVPELPFIFLRLEAPMGGYSSAPYGRPTWQWSLQFIVPVSGYPLTHVKSPSQAAPTGSTASPGAAIFAANCASCHGAAGKGTPGAFPALAGNPDVLTSDPSAIIATVKHGKNVMPSFEGKLSNADIAAVLTYIRTTWGNQASPVSEAAVAAVK